MEGRRQIGQAGDFYRCRVIEILESSPQALDWRDDVLYREQPRPEASTATRFTVQIVSLDSSDAHNLKSYVSQQTAEKKKALIEDDLADLTRSEFSRKYRLPWG